MRFMEEVAVAPADEEGVEGYCDEGDSEGVEEEVDYPNPSLAYYPYTLRSRCAGVYIHVPTLCTAACG